MDNQEQSLSELLQIRRDKLSALQSAGKNPYSVTSYGRTHLAESIKDSFETLEGQTVRVCGRLMSKRGMGKTVFCDLLDGSGRIQLYVKLDDVGEEVFEEFKKWDIGDIAGAEGSVFRTKSGEISVRVNDIRLLSKSLRPLPEKFHGLTDMETRYRQRYIDLISNPEVRDTFVKRSKALNAIRQFMANEGFLEVETPILHMIDTGAAARPFKTHHNTLDIPMLLRIEMELHLKRLIVGGFDRVFEIGRNFRNEGMSPKHNPEFTMCEFYQAYTDYNGMMDLIERLFAHVAETATGTTKLSYQGEEIDLTPPWSRLTMAEAVKKYANIDCGGWTTDEEARKCLKELHIPCESHFTKGDCLNAVFEEKCEEHLIQPTIIMDYPVEVSPLAKCKPDNPLFTERFEFFMNGWEGGNAFSELNDPIDQRKRFEAQVALRRSQGVDARVDEDFLTAMEIGMPPTGGLGFGVDRLVMLLTDSPSIRDVLLFPTMKPID
ncbi:MAG: lysine--tRNA ligase [Oscillospiraceae bacterium]|nr:lysine--tRNA ligase [Oscillospiraceae bacterium]